MTYDGLSRKTLLTTGGPSHFQNQRGAKGFGGSETIEDDHIDYIYLGVHRVLGRVVSYFGSRGDQRLGGAGAKVSFFIGLHLIQDAFGGHRWRQIDELQILRGGSMGNV